MRLQLPTRIPLGRTVLVMAVLFCVQQFQHTDLIFSILYFLFVVIGTIAFNVAGGFSRITGAYVFFSVLLLCGLGVLLKAVVGEAADSNLKVPQLLIGAYASSIVMLLLVVAVVRRVNRGARSLPVLLGGETINYTLSAVGCLLVCVLQAVLELFLPSGSGTFLGILHQINIFPALAIIVGTIGAIQDSDGRRSVNLVSGIALVYVLGLGVTSFSKQAMLTPGLCWLVSAFFCRLQIRRVHAVCILLYALFAFAWVPLLAGGRNRVPTEGAGFLQRIYIAADILTHPVEERALQKDAIDAARAGFVHATYYNQSLGFMERLTIIPVDDAFFDYSASGNRIGYYPVLLDFENFIPHFLFPDKPDVIGGNYYAHQIGGFLAEDDTSTGISFSGQAEAFHVDRWVGVLLLLPAIWLGSFLLTDRICGDMRRAPWGLFVTVGFAHSAAESALGGLIYGMVYGNLILLIAILFCTRVTPILGALFSPQGDSLPPLPQEAATGPA